MFDRKEYWRWNQDTPHMQLLAIQNSLLGSLYNLSDGIGNHDNQARNIVRNAAEINDLIPFIKLGHW